MTPGRYIGRLATFVALSLAAVPAWLWAVWLVLSGAQQGTPAGRALDQFVNAALLNGSNHETVSSHTGRRTHFDIEPPRWALRLRRLLDFFDPGHCWRAAVDEAPILDAIGRAQK